MQLYLIVTDLTVIQQNLDHGNQQTTLDYIGILDGDHRTPDDAYGTIWLQPLWEKLANRRNKRIDFSESNIEDFEIDKTNWGFF